MVAKPEAYLWSSDRSFRSGRGPSWLDLDRVLAMLGPTRSAAVARYRRLMREPGDSAYEGLVAIEGVVKGDEAFARRKLGDPTRFPQARAGWTAERVGRSVAELSGTTLEEVNRQDLRRASSRIRILAAYLGRTRFGIPVAEFARLFRREQSSLVHGVLSLERRIENDPATRQKLSAIDRAICELAGF